MNDIPKHSIPKRSIPKHSIPMDGTPKYRIPKHRSVAAPLLVVILATAGCASTGHLAEYEFNDRRLAVVTVAPPHPDVFTGDGVDLTGEGWAGALFRVGTGIYKESQASKARMRLDSAVVSVDVSMRLADRLLEGGARQLRTRPVTSKEEADYELEVHVKRYGIEADDWDSEARFHMEAEVFLLDAITGRRIWKAKVQESEPVNRRAWTGEPMGGPISDIVTASALANLSVPEMERTLEYLADYCADRVVDKLRKGMDKVRG